jgi:hypothetical protein
MWKCHVSVEKSCILKHATFTWIYFLKRMSKS